MVFLHCLKGRFVYIREETIRPPVAGLTFSPSTSIRTNGSMPWQMIFLNIEMLFSKMVTQTLFKASVRSMQLGKELKNQKVQVVQCIKPLWFLWTTLLEVYQMRFWGSQSLLFQTFLYWYLMWWVTVNSFHWGFSQNVKTVLCLLHLKPDWFTFVPSLFVTLHHRNDSEHTELSLCSLHCCFHPPFFVKFGVCHLFSHYIHILAIIPLWAIPTEMIWILARFNVEWIEKEWH